MTTASDVAALVERLAPFDELEIEHRADALRWLASTPDVFRRTPPRAPPKHLVAYFLLRDARDGSVLLVHHRKAALWLPTGGHVEVGEDPADTVRREAPQELGRVAVFSDPDAQPAFITVTETTGSVADRHTDVSLWHLLTGSQDDDLHPDEREFSAVRWWGRTELAAANLLQFEPHLMRFLAKVDPVDFSRQRGPPGPCGFKKSPEASRAVRETPSGRSRDGAPLSPPIRLWRGRRPEL